MARSATHPMLEALLTAAALLLVAFPARALDIVLVPGASPLLPNELAVFERAAEYWEQQLGGTHTVTVTHERAALPPTRLGQASALTAAGPGNTGLPVSATVTLNSTVPNFFVDPTPAMNEEFFANVSPPYLFPADPAGPAWNQYDLLTLAIHELGHAIGFSSGYADFAANITAAPTTAEFVYVFAGVPTLLDPVTDYFAGFFPNGGVYMPQSEDDTEEGGSTGGLPSHFQDTWLGGTDAASLAVDVMHPTQNQSERILIGPPDQDVLIDAFGLVPPLPPHVPTLAPFGALMLLFTLAVAGAASGAR